MLLSKDPPRGKNGWRKFSRKQAASIPPPPPFAHKNCSISCKGPLPFFFFKDFSVGVCLSAFSKMRWMHTYFAGRWRRRREAMQSVSECVVVWARDVYGLDTERRNHTITTQRAFFLPLPRSTNRQAASDAFKTQTFTSMRRCTYGTYMYTYGGRKTVCVVITV